MSNDTQAAPKSLLELFDEAQAAGDWSAARAVIEKATRIEHEAQILVMAFGPTEWKENGLERDCLDGLWKALYRD